MTYIKPRPTIHFARSTGSYIILMLEILLIACGSETRSIGLYSHGGIIRGDTTKQETALIFTGGDFSDGGEHIAEVLKAYDLKAGFFFTGDFYRSKPNKGLIRRLIADGHYMGPHSDRHLLYCSWEDRDSLLVSRQQFVDDMRANYREMEKFGIPPEAAPYFIPPYEWYNESISAWARDKGWVLFNNTSGTLSQADYTVPSMPNYRSSDQIWDSIIKYERQAEHGLNGFILLIHIGSSPERTDKFYRRLEPLIQYLQKAGYNLVRIDQMLQGLRLGSNEE
ncbi:MAG: polysaccharide deacetylase family protein [Fidelibacterota bacterium]|nr:MAG: polysaccharide deacetylase family protein [Candidatus Neomarinimicrobiota bacterium]